MPNGEWSEHSRETAFIRLPSSIPPRQGKASNSASFWGSWAGSNRNRGQLYSPPFSAPIAIQMFVAGYPNDSANRILLERIDGGLRSLSWFALFREQARGAASLLLFPLNFALFLLPGFAFAIRMAAKRDMRETHLIALILVVGGVIGYICFWAFFASKPLGKFISFAVLICAIVSLVFDLARSKRLREVARSVLPPFIYVLVVGIFYLCIFYLFSDPTAAGAALSGDRFFDQRLPGDQLIPLIFAEKIYSREPLKPFCCGDWLSSDRPPLQAGLSLFEHPFRTFGDAGLNYQLLGTALQLVWICGVWSLLGSLGASKTRIRQVLGLLIFSGFLLFNTTYPWPKLLAATFILLALSIFFEVLRANRPFNRFEMALAAVSLSLALMSHPGSVFSLPGFGLILFSRFRLLRFRLCLLGAAIVALFVLPWVAYQEFYDPPGNRLLKVHLGGQIPVDNRGTWQTIEEDYARQSFRTTLLYKWQNIKHMVGPEPFDGSGFTALGPGFRINRPMAEKTRTEQREFIWNAVGVINLGWLAGLLLLIRRKQVAFPGAILLVCAALVNYLIFALLLFGPNGTVTTHSSLADILFLSIGLSGFLLTLPRPLILAVFALQVFNFVVAWAWSPPFTLTLPPDTFISYSLQLPQLLLALLLASALIWHFGRSLIAEPVKSHAASESCLLPVARNIGE